MLNDKVEEPSHPGGSPASGVLIVAPIASPGSADTPDALARIHFIDDDGDPAGGTGFLFNSSHGLALATTAHALVGSRLIPADPSTWSSSDFRALSEDRHIEVPLPLETARTIARLDDPLLLEDFMVFYASDLPDLNKLAARRTPFDFDYRPPRPGEAVATIGFASADGGTGATERRPSELIGAHPSGYWLAAPPAVPGLSGAPMVSEAGLVRGMQTGYVDTTDPRVVLLASVTLRAMIRRAT